MFRDYDEFGRPLNRQPYPANTVNIPRRPQGYGRPSIDPREAMLQMQQEVEKARAEAATWHEEAQKWHTAVKHREADIQKLQHELALSRQAVTELETSQAETSDAESWQEKYVRLAAEMENSKKRLAQRYAQEAAAETERVLLDMLTVADNLERALAHASGTESETGIALTLKAFTAVMNQHGVQPIEAVGRPFDPTLHEAVGIVPETAYEPGTVTAVTEKGYHRGDKLLRPARVLVAAGGSKKS